jgi:glycosyltransferase involved in cell wall biosynthesis
MEVKMKELVSVCMPTFNRAHYLAESISSVLKQTYKNFELIIVDDGSTDSTPVLMDYFTKLDKRIKYFRRRENLGIAKTRNEAISYAQGEYISIHDSDDFMLPKKLSKSIAKLNKTGADFVYSSYYIGDGEGRAIGMHEPPSEVTIKQIKANSAYPHITIVARAKCFIENPYRPELKVNDDSFLMFDFYKAGYRAVKIKEPLNIVRFHNTRVSVGKQKEIERINEQMQKEADESGLK